MKNNRRTSYAVLCFSLALVIVVGVVPATYAPGVYWAVAIVQLALIGFAAWNVGLSAVRVDSDERRWLAAAGGLLILPWALFSFLPGVGPPPAATAPQNELRYALLLINAAAIGGGMIVLREALSAAGERFYSTLGFAAVLMASPLYLVWAAILIYVSFVKATVGAQLPPELRTLGELSEFLLGPACLLTYVATALFATSLGRAKRLGHRASRAFMIVSSVAVLFIAISILQFREVKAATMHWYDVPGAVATIPFVSWIMPVMLGVVLLRRAGECQHP